MSSLRSPLLEEGARREDSTNWYASLDYRDAGDEEDSCGGNNNNNLHSLLQHTVHLLQRNTELLEDSVGPVVDNSSRPPVPKKRRISKRVVNFLFVMSAFWQLLTIFLLWIVDVHSTSSPSFDIGAGVMLLLQTVHLVLLIITSVKLVKQMAHGTASPWFLVQSYASTLLLFAGIYTLIIRLDPASFEGVRKFRYGSGEDGNFSAFEDFFVLLYFSTTCFTTVGFGDVHPSSFSSLPFVMLQMFFSVAYTVGIFGMGIAHFSSRRPRGGRHPHLEHSDTFSDLTTTVGGGGRLSVGPSNSGARRPTLTRLHALGEGRRRAMSLNEPSQSDSV